MSKVKMPATGNRVTHCAFCQKSNSRVKVLIVTDVVGICDECTLVCYNLANEKGNLGWQHQMADDIRISSTGKLERVKK